LFLVWQLTVGKHNDLPNTQSFQWEASDVVR
jgi:hypothetical protein